MKPYLRNPGPAGETFTATQKRLQALPMESGNAFFFTLVDGRIERRTLVIPAHPYILEAKADDAEGWVAKGRIDGWAILLFTDEEFVARVPDHMTAAEIFPISHQKAA